MAHEQKTEHRVFLFEQHFELAQEGIIRESDRSESRNRAWEAMQRVTDEETAWRAGRERRGRGRSVEAGERERG